jgi:hypothetical protein
MTCQLVAGSYVCACVTGYVPKVQGSCGKLELFDDFCVAGKSYNSTKLTETRAFDHEHM